MAGKDLIFLRNTQLFDQLSKHLGEVGAKGFFSNPDYLAQRAREGFAIFFFMCFLKGLTSEEWFVLQTDEEFPDFSLMFLGKSVNEISTVEFEMVEIPDRCSSYDEAEKIVQKKLSRGYPKNTNLLIYINNSESENWTRQLIARIEATDQFRSIWVLFLLFKNGEEVSNVVAGRISPKLNQLINVPMKSEIFKPVPVDKSIVEEIIIDGKLHLKIGKEAVKHIKKRAMEIRKLNRQKPSK